MSMVNAKIIPALTKSRREMAGKVGRTGTHKNRSNQWLAGTAQRERVDKVVGFKPRVEVYAQIQADMELRGMGVTEWLDMVVESYLALLDVSIPESEGFDEA